MARTVKQLRTCPQGHEFRKTTDCPTCPICERERVPAADFMIGLSAPARRALERAGITTLDELARRRESELLELHGFGPGSIPKLRQVLASRGLAFTAERAGSSESRT